MNITITLNCDNAAFCDIPEIEIYRILSELADNIDEKGIQAQSLRDFNGNIVGKMEVSE
jgi:hypothetical protein